MDKIEGDILFEDVSFSYEKGKEVLHNVQERDYIDSNREDSPLVKAEDAIEIDNSKLSLQEQFDKILNLVEITMKNYK